MKILIELPTWLGDSVMATPAIDNIVNFYGDAEITLIGSSASTEALKYNPNVSSVIVLSKQYSDLFRISKELGEFDIFFSFRSSFRSKIFKLLVRSNSKYQFQKYKYQNIHQVEKYNNFVNKCLKVNFAANKLNISQKAKLIYKESKPVLGINPGASYGQAKRWYPEKFASVAAKLSDKYDILIFGGPAERNISADIEKILLEKKISNYRNLTGKTNISELIDLISSLDLFITGDSGPMHIAASFEIPTVSIFGPTRSDETSQWMNPQSIIVKKNLECQPCMQRICPLGHHKCMKLVEVSDVLDAIKRLK